MLAEVSKLGYISLELFDNSEIGQVSSQLHCHEVKILIIIIILTSNLAAIELHKIWWRFGLITQWLIIPGNRGIDGAFTQVNSTYNVNPISQA